MKRILNKNLFLFPLLFTLTACSLFSSSNKQDGPPHRWVDVSKIKDAVPREEAYTKCGNPESYSIAGQRYYTKKSSYNYVERGVASWYGTKFHKQRTSSGEPYNMFAMTAAHKSLPLPTYAEVTNLENGRHVIVKINDRGPFKKDRIIDLSYVAAKKLGVTDRGTAHVEVKAINLCAPQQVHSPIRKMSASSQSGPIYVQVGAFSDRNNAVRLSNKIRNLAHTPTRIKAEHRSSKGQLYRVQVGPMKNAEQAQAVFSKIKHLNLGYPMTLSE